MSTVGEEGSIGYWRGGGGGEPRELLPSLRQYETVSIASGGVGELTLRLRLEGRRKAEGHVRPGRGWDSEGDLEKGWSR
eukprot:1004149-Rhodomonas_salina.3